MLTTIIPSTHLLNLDYAMASRLLLPDHKRVCLILAGCGGTGSWLAPTLARVARLLAEKLDKEAVLHFVDPDLIEEKNVYRQNFCQAEIGRNKAESLAFRYGAAWGLEINAWACDFAAAADKIFGSPFLPVVVGCVDRASARRQIHKYSQHRDCWWLDCGNHQAAGQVLLGGGSSGSGKPFPLPGLCAWLPLPSEQHPELLEDAPAAPQGDYSHLSCADLAMLDSQGLAINQRIAAEAGDYLVRLLLTHDLTRFATYLDLPSGSSRSNYITPDLLKDYLK